LYIIWIGANDFLSVLNSSDLVNKFFDVPDSEYGKNKIIEKAISSIVHMYSNLMQKGVKNFAIINLPNIGYTPYVLTTSYKKDILDDPIRYNEFSIKLTEAINEFNEKLKIKIEKMKQTSDNKVILVDINKQLNNMIYGRHMLDEGKLFDYQFSSLNSDVLIPNQDKIYIQKPCFSGVPYTNVTVISYWIPNSYEVVENFERREICSNDKNAKNFETNKYTIFWDNPHPSSYTHCFLSHFIHKNLGDENIIPKNNLSLEDIRKECRSIVNYNFNIK
jgi:hypothetical protein